MAKDNEKNLQQFVAETGVSPEDIALYGETFDSKDVSDETIKILEEETRKAELSLNDEGVVEE